MEALHQTKVKTIFKFLMKPNLEILHVNICQTELYYSNQCMK